MPKIILPHIIANRLQNGANLLVNQDAVPVLIIGVDRSNSVIVVSMDSELPKDQMLNIFRNIVKQMESERGAIIKPFNLNNG